ncbi:MAG: hypothetical protein ICV68_00385, partial [Pyrinomonadaceae bacterium]|nr:hypothetical protein [Pyrinomonadaceae bacterium]
MNSTALRERRAPLPSFFVILLACVSFSLCLSCASRQSAERAPLVAVRTLAGAANEPGALRFSNPFGVAVSTDGTLFVTDGEKNLLVQIATDGTTKIVTDKLSTPSAVALAPD